MTLAAKAANVTACWTLDEASGSRADSVGSNTLTDNNTVASASGKFSTAADFESGNPNEYLSCADSVSVSTGDIEFMLRAWVNLESKGNNRTVMGKWESAGGKYDYLLYYDSGSDRFRFIIRDSGDNTVGTVDADNLGSPSTATWYLIHARHSASGNTVGIAVNAGTENTAATSGAPNDSAAIFAIGATTDLANFMDGLIDDALIMKGAFLDADERTEDYNAGTGVAFADWDAAAGLAPNLLRSNLLHSPLLGGRV